ncbi:TonB-dependent receptor domain-containing protein [Roseateles amylovorans]|uniref:TonB-dependent receptor n=1 Tax=Roseateles amylovorans TaxID=2978473 RepID=A0ABY6B3S6_9BURK|nr:TonB-dependent receptor [Roseateles amylovorans]UXH80028.1 TonB-dependent receptor [Roseateles amylovorans]
MFKRKSINLAALMVLGIAMPTLAQQRTAPSPAPAQAVETLQRVEVTGSRIKTISIDTVSPMVTLGVEAIKVEGQRDVEALLNNLPQIFADQGSQVANGATGTATVNLRNLGAARTLVLINGRRLPAGSPRELAADLNQIPIALIKRVEVLTGGASAIYGSDAVAGVVNFIMNDSFTGLQFDYNFQGYNHQQHNDVASVVSSRNFPVPGDKDLDGKSHDFSVTMGANFADNKGNATLFLGHKRQSALLQSERDFTSCALTVPTDGYFGCGGSGTSYPGRFTTLDDTMTDFTIADAAGGTRPWSSTTDLYNFGPINYFNRPSSRYTAAAFAHYDVNQKARVYTEFNFHDDRTVAQIAPSGAFGVPFTVEYDNPLLTASSREALGLSASGQSKDIYLFRRNVEGGGRQDDIRHTSYRGLIGVKGDLNNAWSYDLSTLVGRVVYQATYKNDFSIARTSRALDVVTNPATGAPACRSFVNGTDPNCVPYNIWALGGVTPEALNYLQTPGLQKGHTSTKVSTATINGDLTDYGFKLPTATSGLGVALGFERREEEMDLSTDAAFATGDLAGQGGPTIGVGGKYTVNDVFAEARLPLLENAFMAKQLNLSASYRNSNFSTNQKTDTYGLGLEWLPVGMVKFRGSYQQAIRAANVSELYSAQAIGLYDMDGDPCAGATPSATAAQCARTGVTDAQYGQIADSPSQQYNALFGGNTQLTPETAKTATLGVVLSPTRDLTLSLDVFNIKVDDLIDTVGAPVTLQQCLQTGSPIFCDKVKRDAVGTLWATPQASITATNTNIGSLKTSGVDLAADYSTKLPAGWGRVDLSMVGTYLKKFEVQDLPGLDSYDCAGLYGTICGTPMPQWRHKLRTTWVTPWNVSLALTWRHLDEVTLESSTSQTRLHAATYPSLMKTLGARDYFDLAASYQLTKSMVVRGSVNNLFDRDPPLRSNGSGLINGNTYPVVYDAQGRRIGVNLTATF